MHSTTDCSTNGETSRFKLYEITETAVALIYLGKCCVDSENHHATATPAL